MNYQSMYYLKEELEKLLKEMKGSDPNLVSIRSRLSSIKEETKSYEKLCGFKKIASAISLLEFDILMADKDTFKGRELS